VCIPDAAQASQIVGLLRRLIGDGTVRTAVVFADLNIVTLEANTQLARDLRAYCESELGQLPLDNVNIMIFNIPGEPGEFHRIRGWDYLLPSRGSRRRPLCVPVPFGPPDRGEIASLLFTRCLAGTLEVEWPHWEDMVLELACHVKSCDLSLAALNPLLSSNVLNPQSVRRVTGVAVDSMPADKALMALVGMEEVKEYVRTKLQALRLTRGKPPLVGCESDRLVAPVPDPALSRVNLNLVLTGNPGTGKTTVCKLLGRIYREAGVLPLGHFVKAARKDLVGEYQGHTAVKTMNVIQRSLGGILFIDDAYALVRDAQDTFGIEAVDTLVEAMTDLRGRLVVVMAGYKVKMEGLFEANPGLRDRFGAAVHIEDYRPAEMEQILRQSLAQHGLARPLSPELSVGLPRLCESLYATRDANYANARTLEIIASNLMEQATKENAETVDVCHLPDSLKRLLAPVEVSADGVLMELDTLIGLTGVKKAINELLSVLEVKKRRADKGGTQNVTLSPGHFVFAGRPGTGKTTVARLLARQLYQMQLVQHPDPHETSAMNLMRGYVGQAAESMTAFLRQGLGRLIFIDEAHQLAVDSSQGSDYRKDILQVLVPFSENNRDNCVIVLAGYEDKIFSMLSQDSGAASRFPNVIRFDDYSGEEMVEIFDCFVREERLSWPKTECAGAMARYFESLATSEGPAFANARSVRNEFSRCFTRHAVRCKEDPHADIMSLAECDLPINGQ